MSNFTLYVMRLSDVHVRPHPRQDNGRVCGECGAQVAITIAGLNLLRMRPLANLVCNWCRPPDTVQEKPEMSAPDENANDFALVVMRRADMRVVHPKQDNTRVCSICGEPVGIYPSGLGVLRAYPLTRIICNHCHDPAKADVVLPAPGALDEAAEIDRQQELHS